MATADLNIHSTWLMPLALRQRLAKSSRLTRLVANRKLMDAAYWTAAVVLMLVFGAAALTHGFHLLSSAGIISSSDSISGVSTFVTNIEGHVKWLAITVSALSLAVIGAMFIFGHQSAHQHAMRVGMGIMGLVALPGLIS